MTRKTILHMLFILSISTKKYTNIQCSQKSNYASRYTHAALSHLEHNNLDDALYYLTHAVQYASITDKKLLSLCIYALFRLGNAFFDHKQSDNALIAFKTALSLKNDCSAIYHNIGFTLAEQQGKYHDSIEWYQKALLYDPSNAITHLCLSISLLATGNLEDGFKEYEWRKSIKHKNQHLREWPQEKLWDGTTSIKNKRIFVHSEQGLGDILQFIRYAQFLKQDGATVIVETPHPLQKLLSLCPYIDEIITTNTSFSNFDFQVPLLSLPYLYKTTRETLPTATPYLYASEELFYFWKQWLSDKSHFKIGICWQGDLANKRAKYMPLAEFQHLAHIPGVTLYSLQIQEGQDQFDALENKEWLHCFDDQFDAQQGRFMDTAAVIQNLDLVITVDTSVAHLAGGLGIPTWIIVPFPAEWRWLEHRTDSPWYPSMRIFRQQKDEEWHAVMNRIKGSLKTIMTLQ